MRYLLPLLIVILGGCAPIFRDPVGDYLYYKMQEEKLIKYNKNIDLYDFRIAYSRTPLFQPYSNVIDSLKDEMYNALSNDFSKAERISKRILKHNYVDLDAHRIMVMVFENRNDKTSAKYHSNILNGLIDSILNSGDGLSSESAFVVIAPYEEHIILGVLGLELLSQALIEEDEHYYDVITVKNPNNNKQSTIYLISISL